MGQEPHENEGIGCVRMAKGTADPMHIIALMEQIAVS